MKEKHRVKTKYKSHILIPDMQIRSDVDFSHLEHVGNYIVHAQPDVIVQIGDWADFPSLSTFDTGKGTGEGRRFVDDVRSVRESIDVLLGPIRKYNRGRRRKYTPRMVITLGNHSHRLLRHINDNPAFIGAFSIDALGFAEAGFEVIPFLQIIKIDQIEYVHYVQSSCRGNPISTAAGLLRARHCSISTGHAQKVDIAWHPGTHHIGLISGGAYTHHEEWAGPQADQSKRGIWRKSEVREGTYDPMFVSLDYLRRRWS